MWRELFVLRIITKGYYYLLSVWLVGWLVGWVLWHINPWLFIAKPGFCIYMVYRIFKRIECT